MRPLVIATLKPSVSGTFSLAVVNPAVGCPSIVFFPFIANANASHALAQDGPINTSTGPVKRASGSLQRCFSESFVQIP